MNERVFADDFRKGFLREDDFLRFLEKREENSSWKTVKSKEIRFFAMKEDDFTTTRMQERLKEEGKDAVFQDTLEHTRLMLRVDQERYPVRSCAVKTILDRARVSGNALNKVEKEVLAKILNYCMEVASGDALLRFCEDKVSAVHGGDVTDYAILEMPELFRRTVEYLKSNFAGYTFVGASYDHFIVTALWVIDGEEGMLQEYTEKLQDHGLISEKIALGLRLTTSDTGLSGANLYPMMFFGDESKVVPLGSPLKLEHKNKADLTKFDEQLNLLYAQYSKALYDMNRLMDLYLMYPVNAMVGVMKRIGVPKKYALATAEDFRLRTGGKMCSVYEAYLGIAEVITLMQYDCNDGSKIVQMEENIARAINIRWKDYDIAGEYRW